MKNKFGLLNGMALVATIFINYLSNTGFFNGETMATVSAKYQSLFTPAGYAFAIWGIIYAGLTGFVLYYGPFTKSTPAKEKVLSNIGWWFVASCVVNSVWVVVWLHEYTFLSVILMIVLFITLLKIVQQVSANVQNADVKTTLFLKLPFHIYSGWISVALIANVAAFLKKVQWDGWGLSDTTWTIVMIAIATLVHLFMIWKQRMPAFALAPVWALLAIAVANQHSNDVVFSGAIVAAIFIFVNILFFVFRKKAV